MEVDRQSRAILGFCGAAVVVDPDDLLNAAGIVHLDRHATEIQRIAGGVDQALRGLVPLFDGHHHVLHRLDRDLLADAVRRNSEFVRAHRQAGLIQRKVGNRRLVAGGINVRHRQSIFDILLRGGIIEDHAILHANIQRGSDNDAVVSHPERIRVIAVKELDAGNIIRRQVTCRLQPDQRQQTTFLKHILGCRPGTFFLYNTFRRSPASLNNTVPRRLNFRFRQRCIGINTSIGHFRPVKRHQYIVVSH